MAKIITGRSIGGAVRYNENKVEQGKASLLDMNGFATRDLSTAGKIRVLKALQNLNRRTNTNTLHISLNFSPQDRLDGERLRKIASDYMEGIGFVTQPYLLYLHLDAAHPHVHIVTTNIDPNGKRIETHNLGRTHSEKTRKEIETRYRLIKAERQKKEMINLIRPLEKVYYGKAETKAAISNVTREVMRLYRYTSVGELNAILGLFNVCAYRGEPESDMYRNKGLVYSVLDSKGNRIGVPIKASSLFIKPTLIKLEKQFQRNKQERSAYRNELRETILKVLPGCRSTEELERRLRPKGVLPVFRINNKGRLYGVTYVDHVSRCIFNGSGLGKGLAANSLSVQFFAAKEGRGIIDDLPTKTCQPDIAGPNISINTFPQDAPIPYELRQKKKRKRKKPKL